jgi:sigma-54 dependent transcriptional regulator, acetoin dehydrogenase operon transcriptional activator AcoR
MNESSVRDAWERFVGGGAPAPGLRPAVVSSWQRSKNFKVDVGTRGAPVLSEAELYRRRSDNSLLAAAARLAMQRVSHVLTEAGSMLILTDGSGHIVETIGDTRTIETGREVHLEHGGCWAEEKIGTNAIGTAMADMEPVQIHAAEHFCADVQRWTCAAAPIFHPIGRELIGVIDISGPPVTFSSQNLALVISLSDHIEALMTQSIKNDHARLLGCLQEMQRKWSSNEMMAIDRRGAIVFASPDALRSLANHFEPQHATSGLSYLRSVAFVDWESNISRRFVNARTLLVRDGENELGAVVVFPTRSRTAPIVKVRDRESKSSASIRRQDLDLEQPFRGSAVRGHATTDSPALRAKKATASTFPDNPGHIVHPAAFVAQDPRVKQLCSNVAAAARLRLPVLICGQTGTGKEELARYVHTASGRKGAFVPVNCSALPESLIEAELFGYADGAFTGARRGGSPGLAKEAHGGTLFLDEIGDMPFALQSVLLRFLDDFTVRPIGGASSKVDVLIVSATNVDLGLAVASRRFRADLLYRLNTMHATLPPLSERTDFQAIVLHLLAMLNPDFQISTSALEALAKRTWHGNVRELKGTLERISLAMENNLLDEVLVESIPAALSLQASSDRSLRGVQRARLLEVHAQTGGNISETARRLNVCRNTVYKALESSGDG